MQGKLLEIKKSVDAEIENKLQNDNPLIDALYKSASYSASGGKRVRAIFAYLIAGLFDADEEKMLIPSCALELVHAASLVMDDLPYMDDSQLRRGKPANHVVFGQDAALLASIGLISQALQVVFEDTKLSVEEQNKISALLSGAFGFRGLAAGQFVDLKLRRKNVDFEIIEFINQRKTAALFSAAGQIACIIGKADEKQMEAVKLFSENIGFAFQIIDDMLENAGAKKIAGKNEEYEKLNFVKLVGEEQAQTYLKEYRQKAEEALAIFGNKADDLKAYTDYLISRAN